MNISKYLLVLAAVAAMILAPANDLSARGRGGGGARGGGGFSRGGGGMSRPSASRPSPSRPSYSRPSTPSYNRPSASRPSAPSYSRPSTRPSAPGANRPSVGTRPSTGTRPGVGTRPGTPSIGTRPGVNPGSRPSVRPSPGTRPTTRPGVGTSPGVGNRPGVGNNPGFSNRPSQRPSLPGMGNVPGAGNRPGVGERPGVGNRPGVGDRPTTRPSPSDRANNIRDRMEARPSQLPAAPHDRWQNRQDQWQNWHNNHYGHHRWHNGHCHAHWHPGSRWNYWWNNYPALTAFGVTTWAVNRVGYAFGYYDYGNPYATTSDGGYDYSEPLVMTPDETTLSEDPNAPEPPPSVSPEALAAFDRARQQFFAGQYDAALASTDEALKLLPNDAVIHEFRALTLFALAKYEDSAATLYAVLGVGPGWDWTTMSGLYPSAQVYTKQLRALEDYRDQNPDDPAARFVLAYHYTTAGHDAAAAGQLQKLLAIQPTDQLAAQLLLQVDPNAEIPNPPQAIQPPKPATPVAAKELIGSWIAARGSGTFAMQLKEDNTFSWTYTEKGQPQAVTGVWAIDDDSILALEMNDQGVMLAQVILKDNALDFYMLGDTQGQEPLKFNKQ